MIKIYVRFLDVDNAENVHRYTSWTYNIYIKASNVGGNIAKGICHAVGDDNNDNIDRAMFIQASGEKE